MATAQGIRPIAIVIITGFKKRHDTLFNTGKTTSYTPTVNPSVNYKIPDRISVKSKIFGHEKTPETLNFQGFSHLAVLD